MQAYHQPDEIRTATNRLLDILIDYYSSPKSSKAVNYRSKEELVKAFYQGEPPNEERPLDDVLKEFKESILPASVKTWHPLFMNQMFAGASFPSIIGDLMASMMNPTLATWEASPVATIIEKNVSQWMAQMMGLPKGSWGIFLPGGSLSNLIALTIARNQFFGMDIRQTGIPMEKKPVLICSEASHYSIANAANILGLGSDHLLKIKTRVNGSMDTNDLEKQLQQCDRNHQTPFAIIATMGLTVSGCFDPLDEMARICKPRGIHIHVDAAFGGGMALTQKGKRHFTGIEHADTLTWDAHKTLHMPLTSSVLLLPNPQLLKSVFSQKEATYLFHPQPEHEIEDLGKYTPLCGKRFDALKLWLLWHTYGTENFREQAENRFKLTEDFGAYLKSTEDFHMDYQSESPISCFHWAPKEWQKVDRKLRAPYSNKLHRTIREEIKQDGNAFFNIALLNGMDQFRFILINPLTTLDQLKDLVSEIRARALAYCNKHPQPFESSGEQR